MARQLFFDDEQAFLQQLENLLAEGLSSDRLRLQMPYHCAEAEKLLGVKPSKLGGFTLGGALAGLVGGFLLAALTSLDWPIVTGGKPIVAVPPFLLIGYLMAILFGSLASFAGFLLLTRMPRIDNLIEEQDFDSRFVITITDEVAPCTTPN